MVNGNCMANPQHEFSIFLYYYIKNEAGCARLNAKSLYSGENDNGYIKFPDGRECTMMHKTGVICHLVCQVQDPPRNFGHWAVSLFCFN